MLLEFKNWYDVIIDVESIEAGLDDNKCSVTVKNDHET